MTVMVKMKRNKDGEGAREGERLKDLFENVLFTQP